MTNAERDVSRLVFPAIRWQPQTGYAHEQAAIERALAHGVGGFILFGGEVDAARELITGLRRRSAHPLLVGSDLERGAGQQFAGATPLPPLRALGSLDDTDATRWAAALTGREARAIGIDWVYAPVADLDSEARNPIVGSRSFGAEPERVARHVAAWVEACRAQGVLACAKHFPGHGRTTDDSHAMLPRVSVPRDALEADLEPFRAAIAAGVDTLMSAHVIYEAIDAGLPATLSPRALGALLRNELAFGGLVVTDALNMAGVLERAGDEGRAAVAALTAGCDALLFPDDVDAVVGALKQAAGRTIPAHRIADAIARLNAAIASVAGASPGARADPRSQNGAHDGGTRDDHARDDGAGDNGARSARAPAVGAAADRERARSLGALSIVQLRGTSAFADAVGVVTIDDDVGGRYPPPPRTFLLERLRARGVSARPVADGQDGADVVALYADVRAWKQRAGLSAEAEARAEAALASSPDATLIVFGHPRMAAHVAASRLAVAWGGEALMQEAAADWIAARVAGA